MFSKWSDKLAAFVKALAPRKTVEVVQVAALATVLALGVTLAAAGVRQANAQLPPGDCAGDYNGELCAEGEICVLFICLDFKTYWPDGTEGGCIGTDIYGLPCGGGSVWE